MFCTNCGHRNSGSSNFCSSCGAALSGGDDSTVTIRAVEPEANTDEELAVNLDEVPDGAGVLVVRRGPNAGSKFLLDRPVTQVGRHPDSDIFLDDITVSRRHAEFVRTAAGYTLKDAGSLNGTYLNRERVDEMQLGNGDEVQIGKFKLVFLAGA